MTHSGEDGDGYAAKYFTTVADYFVTRHILDPRVCYVFMGSNKVPTRLPFRIRKKCSEDNVYHVTKYSSIRGVFNSLRRFPPFWIARRPWGKGCGSLTSLSRPHPLFGQHTRNTPWKGFPPGLVFYLQSSAEVPQLGNFLCVCLGLITHPFVECHKWNLVYFTEFIMLDQTVLFFGKRWKWNQEYYRSLLDNFSTFNAL